MEVYLRYVVGGVLISLCCSQAAASDIVVESVYIRLSEELDVPARATGILQSLNVKEGQYVSHGESLGQIEDTEEQLLAQRVRLDLLMARKQAENRISLEFAKKSSAIAKKQLARAKRSREDLKQSISLKEIENFELTLERALLDMKQRQYELDIAELSRLIKETELSRVKEQIARRKIVSPISGMIVKVERRAGEWVEPGERVVRIVRLDQLRAEGFIANEAFQNLHGASVTVSLETPQGNRFPFPGKIVFIDPEVEPTTNQVRVRAEIVNLEMRLRPGMRVRMVIHRDQPKKAPALGTSK